MRKLLLVIYLSACFLFTKSQVQQNNQCGTVTPSLDWERLFSSKVNDFRNRNVNSPTVNFYTIPVIVHILHDNNPIGVAENISWAQVKSQIDILNADFSGTNADIGNVPAIFQSAIAGNTGIQFCLAKTDPDGNVLSEEGVERINWIEKGWNEAAYIFDFTNFENYFNYIIKPATIWNPKRYLNVWISSKNSNGNPFTDHLTGFGLFPTFDSSNIFPELALTGSGIETEMTSGLWVYHKFWGNVGTALLSAHNLGRIATHEIGHWLGIYHIWETLETAANGEPLIYCYGGSDCANKGDRCCDTPPQLGVGSQDCATNPIQNTCTESPNDTIDMFMNYMAYTNDACRIMFTKDQTIRMQTTMQFGTFRSTLNASTACQSCPELVLLNPSTSSYYVENNVTVSFIERNKGLSNAAPNNVNFHLSLDNVLTPGLNGDIYLDYAPVTQTLVPNSQTNVISKVLTIPSTVVPGIYYLFMAADGTGAVNECVEDNNFATVIISVSNTPSPTQASYRYWFDNNFSNSINVNVISGNNIYNLQSLVSTTLLTAGLHSLNLQFKDAGNKWSSITSSFFYKVSSLPPAGSPRFEYWFDNSFNTRTITTVSSSNNLIVLSNLTPGNLTSGLHTFNMRFKPDGKHWSSITSSFFYKSTVIPTGTAKYEYWMDNNYQNRTQVNNTTTNNFVLLNNISDNGLAQGLHVFNIRFSPDGKLWSSVVSSFFYKTNSSATSTPKFQYWFDNNSQDTVTSIISSTNNYVLLDSLINSLPVGLHTLNIRFKPNGGLWSSVVSNFFYKNQPSGISNNNIARCVYWYDNNWQNPNLLYYSEQSNLNSTINTDAADLSTGMHRVSMMFRDDRGVWSSVVSDSFNRIASTPICPINNREFIAGVFLSNTATRQWQLDAGSGFVNISNNSNYFGANTDTLHIINAPTSWYGYKYRCILTDGSNSATGQIYTLKFSLIWNGNADNAWENPANWNCTVLPDANTDVIINPGSPHFPEVNTSGTCRSLTANPGVNVIVKTGSTFIISH